MENPTCLNVICPQCSLTWLVPNVEGKFYSCFSCNYVMFDRQVRAHATRIANDQHQGIYITK